MSLGLEQNYVQKLLQLAEDKSKIFTGQFQGLYIITSMFSKYT
jgi:hypothetical protein